jgi:hypothetical protein
MKVLFRQVLPSFLVVLPSVLLLSSVCSATTKFIDAPTIRTGKKPVSIASADFNGDGRDDLVVANNENSNVTVFLNQGKAKFAAASFATGLFPNTVGAADVNNDGILDIIVTDSAGVSILIGNGDGTFKPAKTCSVTCLWYHAGTGVSWYPSSLAVAAKRPMRCWR